MVTVNQKYLRINEAQITHAPSGALQASGPSILFDAKTLVADNAEVWDSDGTGTTTFQSNKLLMEVDSGEFLVRQSRQFMPYFSGYPLYIEMTFDGFDVEEGVTKRIGYFSSSTTPYTANLDGFCVEADGTTYRLRAWRDGTETVNIPYHKWAGRAVLEDYDFSMFTAIMFDFLWLGGAALRLWVCTPYDGWVLAHAAPYIGGSTNTICLNPQQPLRYEIRGDSAAGSMRPICAQASVLGDVSQNSFGIASVNTSNVSCAATGTVYVLQGVRKSTTYRNTAIRFSGIATATASNNDTGILYLLKNPTLSAGLSYSAFSRLERALGTGQTVTGLGTVISAAPVAQVANRLVPSDYRMWAGQNLDNTFDEYVLAFEPLTTNQSHKGVLTMQEYG